MSRVGMESMVILKGESRQAERNNVMAYMTSVWSNAAVDSEWQTVTITNAPVANLVNIADADDYNNVAVVDGVLNEDAVTYLKDIWGVSTDDATLTVDAANNTISLTPTFKRCCEREGMKNLKNYVDTAMTQNAFLSFYAHNNYPEDNAENGYGINLSKYTRELLRYCSKVGARVMNAKDGVRDYFSFRYSDFISLKSNM